MTSEHIALRHATPADAQAIARVHVASYRDTYRGLLSDDVIDGMDVNESAKRWRLRLARPDVCTTVVMVGDAIAGFCCLHPTRDEGEPDSVGEISTIYVHPDYWSRGLGRSLCERALQDARDLGFAQLTLWVLSTNERAIKFYERVGFYRDGKEKSDASYDHIAHTGWRYRIAVDEAVSESEASKR